MSSERQTHIRENKVHQILAYSYAVHFLFLLVGVCLDLIFNFKVFDNRLFIPMGISLLLFGTFLIVWAQHTSRNLNKENITKRTFSQGPYSFTRVPTNFGLFFLMLGFGMILNAFFVILTSFLSFVIAKFFFLDKQEKILAAKYGAPYLEYQKSVKF